jgi:hypothetical protein
MSTTIATIVDVDALPVTVESESLFKTSFLRDGSSGKSFAIIQANESIQSVSYTVYERSAEAFSTRSFQGSVTADAPVFSFIISKGSKYWVIADTNSVNNIICFEVDPNKRRLGVGANKKRAAAAEPAAISDDKAAAPASAEPEKAASAASAAPKSKKIKA